MIYGYDFNGTGDLAYFRLFKSRAKALSELAREMNGLTDQQIIDTQSNMDPRSAMKVTRNLVATEDLVVLYADITYKYQARPRDIEVDNVIYSPVGSFDKTEIVRGILIYRVEIESGLLEE